MGRASGLQVAVETLRAEVATLRDMNTQLLNRVLGTTAAPPSPVTFGTLGPVMGSPEYQSIPNVVGGVPVGSPRPPVHIPLGSAFDPALPPVGAAPARHQQQYAGNETGDQDFFTDMGDDAARVHKIELDETTGALVGGPSLPPPPQNRTQ